MSSPIMIRVIDNTGKQYLVNLQFVEAVQFPSPVPELAGNLNLERVVMEGGEVINLNPGTWEAALAALYAEFSENPQPAQNVKGQLYIMPPTP
jgi:hypothetical protein